MYLMLGSVMRCDNALYLLYAQKVSEGFVQ